MSATFLGIGLSQTWEDLIIWEEFFNTNPITTFIELGTGHGGMSTFLALQCAQRGIQFYTFDHQIWFDFETGIPKILGLSSKFRNFDLFSDVGTSEVASIISVSPKPIAIFMDDGNKPREWKTFAPLTSMGDFLIIHDWDTEFFAKDLLDIRVERIMIDLCDLRTTDWKAMWFRRI
jgi:cephalosporin hydroxylase